MKVWLALLALFIAADGANVFQHAGKFLSSSGNKLINQGRVQKDLFLSQVNRMGSGVQKMAIDEEGKIENKIFGIGHLDGEETKAASPVVFDDQFHWKSCGSSNSIIQLKTLSVKPAPVSLPGTLSFSFDGLIQKTIPATAKITANVTIEFYSYGRWTKIPCLGEIGSCDYQDLCSLLKPIQCPQEFTSKGIPCSCPFQKGEYDLPLYSVDVLAEVFLRGQYRASANLTEPSLGNIGCLQIAFTVA